MGFKVLTAAGAIKTGTVPTTDVSSATGTLTVAHGGTGVATLTAHGVLIGEGAGNIVAAAVGTTGQVLTGVTGADPVFAAPAASGALVLLEQHTASASATLVFTTGITSTYDDYVIRLINVLPASAAQALEMRVSTDGGGSYDATANYFSSITNSATAIGNTAVQQSGATFFQLAAAVDNTLSNGGLSGQINLFNPLSASIRKTWTIQCYYSKAADAFHGHGMGLWNVTTAVNALQFLFASGNITSGTIRLYGVVNT
jgi:hypothetical protein